MVPNRTDDPLRGSYLELRLISGSWTLRCPATISTPATPRNLSAMRSALSWMGWRPLGMRQRAGLPIFARDALPGSIRRELAVECRDEADRNVLRAALWF